MLLRLLCYLSSLDFDARQNILLDYNQPLCNQLSYAGVCIRKLLSATFDQGCALIPFRAPPTHVDTLFRNPC